MIKKYRLSNDSKTYEGRKLYRVIGMCGLKGGFIEHESNLSHTGECFVYDNAIVCGDAVVRNNAVVKNNAIVKDNATVCGSAIVQDNAIVKDNAYIDRYGILCNNTIASEYATVQLRFESGEIFFSQPYFVGSTCEIWISGIELINDLPKSIFIIEGDKDSEECIEAMHILNNAVLSAFK